MFIGREKELSILEKCYHEEENGLILISGQPLVGKTELVSQFLTGKKGEYYFAKPCIDQQQLQHFSMKMIGDEMTFSDWEQALSFLETYPVNEKRVLIIDEFQNIQKGDRLFLSHLKRIWETKLTLKKWFILLVTSSNIFLEKEFFGNSKHYEKHLKIHLKVEELDGRCLPKLLPHYHTDQWIRTYSLIGGNPFLLKKWDKDVTVETNIKNQLLQKDSGFHYLVESTFYKEIREPQVYFTLLSFIGSGKNKLSELNDLLGIEKNKLAVYLKNLMNLGLIYREYSNEKYQSNAQSYSGVYQISQPYIQFYFQFIYPNLVDLEVGDWEGTYEYEVTSNILAIYQRGFKEICIQAINRMNLLGELPFKYGQIGKWWRKDVDFDLLGYGPKDQVLVGQCLYNNSDDEIDVALNQMIRDAKRYFSGQSIQFYLFTNGVVSQKIKEKYELMESVVFVPNNSLFN